MSRAQPDWHFNFGAGSGSGFGQNIGIGSGSGSGLKMAFGFFGIFYFDLKQQEFSQFSPFGVGTRSHRNNIGATFKRFPSGFAIPNTKLLNPDLGKGFVIWFINPAGLGSGLGSRWALAMRIRLLTRSQWESKSYTAMLHNDSIDNLYYS
jgi:hypothetical protein